MNYEEHIDELLTKESTSSSKQILNELFPMTISAYDNPISMEVYYPDMIVGYLGNTMLSIPGVKEPISVKDYFKIMNVTLDESDPYTYLLSVQMIASFQRNRDLKYEQQLLNILQNKNANRWRSVR